MYGIGESKTSECLDYAIAVSGGKRGRKIRSDLCSQRRADSLSGLCLEHNYLFYSYFLGRCSLSLLRINEAETSPGLHLRLLAIHSAVNRLRSLSDASGREKGLGRQGVVIGACRHCELKISEGDNVKERYPAPLVQPTLLHHET